MGENRPFGQTKENHNRLRDGGEDYVRPGNEAERMNSLLAKTLYRQWLECFSRMLPIRSNPLSKSFAIR